MRSIQVIQASDVIALVHRIAVNGTVENDQLYAGLQRLERSQISEKTPFDYADEKYQSPNFPPMGRWETGTQGKDTQSAVNENL
jgi:hypothetical protein